MPNTWSNMVRGVAIGDAWGNPAEFQSIYGLTRDNKMGPGLPKELEITDDTQMTLYLAAALDDSWGGTEQEVKDAIIDAYLTYADDPDNNRAPGMTVMGSLRALKRAKRWQDATSTSSDGCGTVMRTTPCAFLPEATWVGITAFAAALTHGTANGVAAAILNVAVLRDILTGKAAAPGLIDRALLLAETAPQRGLTETGTWIEGLNLDLAEGFTELARMLRLAQAELPKLAEDPWALEADPSGNHQPWVIKKTGHGGGWRAHECLVIALVTCDMIPSRPGKALRRSVTTEGDSDTIGAVTGGLLGALYPQAFMNLWIKQDVRAKVESRYVAWIENEADDYPFEDPKSGSWIKKLLAH